MEPDRPGPDDQARRLISDLLETEQFPEAMRQFAAQYVNDSQGKMRSYLKSGDINRTNYECGVLETFELLLDRLTSYSKRTT